MGLEHRLRLLQERLQLWREVSGAELTRRFAVLPRRSRKSNSWIICIVLTYSQNLYNNVTYMYPDSQIWLAGHSLGGALASLLGATFGVPTVAFEAPGERQAAKRLHLPFPPAPASSLSSSANDTSIWHSLHPVVHIYHTADPIPQGTCTGVRSLCAKGGYALETRCHLGKTILYDTIGRYGWRQTIANHRIAAVIGLLGSDWEETKPVPEAEAETDCVVCFLLSFRTRSVLTVVLQDCFKWTYGRGGD